MARRRGLKSYRTAMSLTLGIFELVYVLGIGATLTVSPGDCATPLKAWLQTLMTCFAVHFLLLVSTECLPYLFGVLMHKVLTYAYAVASVLLSIFIVVWFVVGNVWYWETEEACKTEFASGYLLVYVVLVVYYCVLGLALCGGCLLGVFLCVGGGLTTRSSNY